MYFRSVLLIVCVLFIIVHNDVEAKPFLEYFFDNTNFENNYQHRQHHRHRHVNQPEAPRPVGGKERYKQICNVIRGINDCYA